MLVAKVLKQLQMHRVSRLDEFEDCMAVKSFVVW